MVIVKESHEKYFVTWRSRCLLLAAANMRGSTIEENSKIDAADLQELEEQWEKGEKQYEDWSGVPPVQEGEMTEDKTWEAQEDLLRFGKKKGRTRREAVEMMKGLKSVRHLVRSKFENKHPKRQRQVAPRPVQRMKKRMQEPGVEELPPVVSMDEYSPSIAAESVSEGELERFWEDVKRQEDAYADEDERRLKTLEEKRKKLLDDVPLCLKRKAEEDDEQKAKIPRTMFQQLQVMVSDQEFKGLLRQKILKKGEERKRHSQWLPKEVKQIRRLLDLPVSAVRLHRTPRKKLQPVPNGKKRRRITIMLLEGPGEAMIVDESTKDMEKPRKTCSVAWRGLTVFVNPEAKKSKKEPPHKAYVQIDENTYEASLKSSEEVKIWKDLVEKEQVWQVYKQVLLLKLKASGKELDPRWFSEEEAKKFQDSDLREWEAWIKNGVIKRLTPEEAASVPKSAIFRLPLRIVRVGSTNRKIPKRSNRKAGL